MEYKTIIEIINQANNPQEAADIAGDYLCGLIDTGVKMKCKIKPVKPCWLSRLIFISLIILIPFFAFSYLKYDNNNQLCTINPKERSVIQPPLKTDLKNKDLRDILQENTR